MVKRHKPPTNYLETMFDQIRVAARWWAEQLRRGAGSYKTYGRPSVSATQVECFEKSLAELLQEKYEGHWYTNDSNRGSGFRSLSYDSGILDPVVTKAAQKAGIHGKNLARLFHTARRRVVHVDPARVCVSDFSMLDRLHQPVVETLWQRDPRSTASGSRGFSTVTASDSSSDSSAPSSPDLPPKIHMQSAGSPSPTSAVGATVPPQALTASMLTTSSPYKPTSGQCAPLSAAASARQSLTVVS